MDAGGGNHEGWVVSGLSAGGVGRETGGGSEERESMQRRERVGDQRRERACRGEKGRAEGER